jgi:hypothetical protein
MTQDDESGDDDIFSPSNSTDHRTVVFRNTTDVSVRLVARDGIHQYFYNFSIFFLSFFYLFSKLLLTPLGHHLT